MIKDAIIFTDEQRNRILHNISRYFPFLERGMDTFLDDIEILLNEDRVQYKVTSCDEAIFDLERHEGFIFYNGKRRCFRFMVPSGSAFQDKTDKVIECYKQDIVKEIIRQMKEGSPE